MQNNTLTFNPDEVLHLLTTTGPFRDINCYFNEGIAVTHIQVMLWEKMLKNLNQINH